MIDLRIDVSEAAGLDEHLETAVTVTLPEQVPARPIVCFAWPRGGYARRYFAFDMPALNPSGQADWGEGVARSVRAGSVSR